MTPPPHSEPKASSNPNASKRQAIQPLSQQHRQLPHQIPGRTIETPAETVLTAIGSVSVTTSFVYLLWQLPKAVKDEAEFAAEQTQWNKQRAKRLSRNNWENHTAQAVAEQNDLVVTEQLSHAQIRRSARGTLEKPGARVNQSRTTSLILHKMGEMLLHSQSDCPRPIMNKHFTLHTFLFISILLLSCALPPADLPKPKTPIDAHQFHQELSDNPGPTLRKYGNSLLLVQAGPVEALTHPNTVMIKHHSGKPILLHFQKEQQTAGLQPGMTIKALCTAKPTGFFTKTLTLRDCRWDPRTSSDKSPPHP